MDVYEAVTSQRAVRPACPEEGAGARAVRRGLGAVRVEPPAVARLRADRGAAGGAQEARRRAPGRGRPLGRAGVRAVPARTEVPLPRAPVRLRRAALRRTRHFARGPGGAPEGRFRELGVFRRARRPVLLHRPQRGPVPMVRRRHVSADRHAAAPRRRAAQLRRRWRSKAKRQVARGWLADTDGMGEVSQDRAVRANIPDASRVPSVRR